MKYLIIADLHGKTCWKNIIAKEFKNQNYPDEIIFLGDFFDNFEKSSAAQQISNFKEICEYKKSIIKEAQPFSFPAVKFPRKITMLIGNHDHHYFQAIGYSGTSGYQTKAWPAISQVLEENKDLFQMAYQVDKLLFTHAGVSKTFLKNNGWDEKQNICEFLNELWQYKPKSFSFVSSAYSPIGDNVCQTPIWIRPRSLMKDSKDLDLIQVVGHTQQNKIDIEGKATNKKYWFIDTLETSSEYLIIDINESHTIKFSCKKYKNNHNVKS